MIISTLTVLFLNFRLDLESTMQEAFIMNKKQNSILIKGLVPVILIALYFAVPQVRETINQWTMVFKKLSVDDVRNYILSFGVLAPVTSFFLMVFQSVAAPLPAFLITFANAAIFGWVWGAVLSWSSAMAGAVLCFYIAKIYGRGTVEKLTSKFALESVDLFFEKYGSQAILIARLLPFMSFDIVSYAAGLTSMSFWSFFWATGLGQLPATIIYSYIGGMLTGSARMVVAGLLTLFALTAVIFLVKKMWNDKEKKSNKKAA